MQADWFKGATVPKPAVTAVTVKSKHLQMVLDPALCSVLVLNGSRCHLYLKWPVHNSTDGMQIFQHIHIDAVNRTMYAVHAVH